MDFLPTATDTEISRRPDVDTAKLEDQEHLYSPTTDTEEREKSLIDFFIVLDEVEARELDFILCLGQLRDSSSLRVRETSASKLGSAHSAHTTRSDPTGEGLNSSDDRRCRFGRELLRDDRCREGTKVALTLSGSSDGTEPGGFDHGSETRLDLDDDACDLCRTCHALSLGLPKVARGGLVIF